MARFIITAAVSGSTHAVTMSPYLPITLRQITDEAARAHEARGILGLKGLDRVNW